MTSPALGRLADSNPDSAPRRIVINWDTASIQFGLLDNRPHVSAEFAKQMLEEMVDEHARAAPPTP